MPQPKKINLDEKFRLFNDYWSPKVVADLNDSQVKLAKFKGEFNWHHHKDEVWVIVIEPNTTLNTGNVHTDKTVENLQKI